MKSAILGGICGAVVAAGVLLVADDDEPAREREAPQVARTPAAATSAVANTDVGRIFEQAGPATVSIAAGDGQGSGFLVDARGTIVTNAHVVGTARDVTVRFGPDGERLDGRVRGSDPGSDLAIVTVAQDDLPDDVEPLELAEDETVEVGEAAVAIGNPFGLPRTVTVGIVSAIGRTISAPNGFSIPGAVQTDAAINPGNSGGPLLDAEGRVIGVNSQIETTTGAFAGIGFAVPAGTVRTVVPDLQDDGRVRRGYLGVSSGEPEEGDGAEVGEVVQDGPADRAGVRRGDVITAIAGQRVTDSDDVVAAIASRRAGDVVTVTVRRGGATRELEVRLGEQPRRDQPRRQRTPFPVPPTPAPPPTTP